MGATEFALTRSSRGTTCGMAEESPARMKRLTEKTRSTRPKNAGPVSAPVTRTETPRIAAARMTWLTTMTRLRGQRSRSTPTNGPRAE